MMSWALALALFLFAIVIHLMIVIPDYIAPKPRDPYRYYRFRDGESRDPDAEVAANPRFPERR